MASYSQNAVPGRKEPASLGLIALVLQVRVQLQGTHALPVWSAKEPESSLNLPSFNAYPQLSVTAAGEYLMMLPQMLESLLNDSQEGLDTEWLDKVCSQTVCCCSVLRDYVSCGASFKEAFSGKNSVVGTRAVSMRSVQALSCQNTLVDALLIYKQSVLARGCPCLQALLQADCSAEF